MGGFGRGPTGVPGADGCLVGASRPSGPSLLRPTSAGAAVVAAPGPTARSGGRRQRHPAARRLHQPRDRRDRPAGRGHRLHLARGARRRRVLRRRRRRLGLRLQLRGARHRRGGAARCASRPTAASSTPTGSSPAPRATAPAAPRRGAPGCPARRTARRATSTSATRSSPARASQRPLLGHVQPRGGRRRRRHRARLPHRGRARRPPVPLHPDDAGRPHRGLAVRRQRGGHVGHVGAGEHHRPDRAASTTAFNGGEGAWIAGRHALVHHQGRQPRVGARPRAAAAHRALRRRDDRRRAAHRGRQHRRPRAVRRPVRGRGRREHGAVPHHHGRRADTVAPFLRSSATPARRSPARPSPRTARACTSARSAAPTGPPASPTRSPGRSAPGGPAATASSRRGGGGGSVRADGAAGSWGSADVGGAWSAEVRPRRTSR